MRTALVVFTRDLRVHDQPALAAATRAADLVVPAFVFDDAIRAPAARRSLLLDALHALAAPLVVRRGVWIDEVARLVREHDVDAVFLNRDVSPLARRREAALAALAVTVEWCDGITAVAPGAITPSGGDHYRVFTPYYRRWLDVAGRGVVEPAPVELPPGVSRGRMPDGGRDGGGGRDRGGEPAARARFESWRDRHLHEYEAIHDDLAADATSHLSVDLHFGCLSANAIVYALRDDPKAAPFLRQLCWRDFFAQVLAARPDAAWDDYVDRGLRWNDDPSGLAAWKEGRTGFPIVDAAMRQLLTEGFVHNRARMIAASFLTKDLMIDWREGARHYLDHLVDGDVAQNNLNWQWVAGTGTDANPHRVFNPWRQGERFDPEGVYIRRHVEELRDAPTAFLHDPDAIGPLERQSIDYPEPIVDHATAIAAYRAARA